jgi:long-chain acyl-CoA synthetase
VELHGLYSLGASLGLAEGVEQLLANMAEIRPTVVLAVPRVFNKLYAGLHRKMETMPPVKRRLLQQALAVAAERRALRDQGRRSLRLDLLHALLDRLVLANVRRSFFGGRLQWAISGGAAISREVAGFIDDIGVTVYEGYGLTETSPIATANSPLGRRMGSVGRAIPGVRIEIDRRVTGDPRQGEIIVHGHNVMLGYHQLPEENARVFTPDHGFRTGDLGYLDADGYLFITGRIKEQFKLENGKYVAPVPIEEAIKLSPFVANVLVHGANRPFNVALVVPELTALRQWASTHGVPAEPVSALLEHPRVRELYRDEIAARMDAVKGYEKVRDFALVAEDFTVENELLTASMKLRRSKVVERYQVVLDRVYTRATADLVESAMAAP